MTIIKFKLTIRLPQGTERILWYDNRDDANFVLDAVYHKRGTLSREEWEEPKRGDAQISQKSSFRQMRTNRDVWEQNPDEYDLYDMMYL